MMADLTKTVDHSAAGRRLQMAAARCRITAMPCSTTHRASSFLRLNHNIVKFEVNELYYHLELHKLLI